MSKQSVNIVGAGFTGLSLGYYLAKAGWQVTIFEKDSEPGAKFIHDEDGRRGSAVSSLVSGDCIVSGSAVSNSLLFTGCRTHSFASLEYVVALPKVVVGRKAQLKNCVIDRGVVIPEGLVVGQDPDLDAKWFRRTDSGVVLITQAMLDARSKALN